MASHQKEETASSAVPIEGRAVVEGTLRTARRTVALALLTVVLVLGLAVIERLWFLRAHDRATERVAEAQRVSGAVRLADEQLTMSAFMAAATGEQRWIDRYAAHLPEIDAAIAAGEVIAPGSVARRFNQQTKEANDRLVALETAAFDAVRAGRTAQARTILDSPAYVQDKQRLTDGTREFTDSTLRAMQHELAAVRSRASEIMVAVLALALAASLLTWHRLTMGLASSRGALVDVQDRIQRLATSDALTGLPNRKALHDAMQLSMARSRRERHRLALLMIDLDRFKPVNDRHGHHIGDLVLREVARRMGHLLRGGELHARYGGDEFVALIDEGADPAVAHRVAERLIRGLSLPITIDGLTVNIGASVGIARFPDDAAEPDQLLRRADLALYRAKSSGRGSVCYFDAALDSAVQEREALELRLREAIERGEIVPHYQPVVDLAARQVQSVELLSRWQHPERGLLPPSEFIALAEHAGLIGALTLSVLRQACDDLARMPAHWRVAINVAPSQIQDPQLIEQLLQVIRGAGADPRRFEIELTETALVADIDAARRTIEALKREGITVALDDFGTGYSSLSCLSQLWFDKIKIDRSFIATLHESDESVKIVQSIIGLGASLDVQVVAEGVETERDAHALAGLCCASAQGFLFARPMAIDALLQMHGEALALEL
jgi:diguanylate cyclase (GGDEF)-like protein